MNSALFQCRLVHDVKLVKYKPATDIIPPNYLILFLFRGFMKKVCDGVNKTKR